MLRGAKEEADEMGMTQTEMISKINHQFESIGITLKKNNDTFKSTFDILNEVGKKWDEISDMKRAEILEVIAGI